MDADAVLEGLNDAQRAAVASTASPLCILAGAGSGKTRVLTRRIAHRVATGTADPRHVLALTFTRKAAGELTTRLRALGLRDRVAAGTFHAIAYAQLRGRWTDQGVRAPALLERKGRLIARLLPRTGREVPTADVAAEIEWAKARLVRPPQYVAAATRAGRRPPLEAHAMAALFERYEEEKQSRRVVDFDDLLLLCVRALELDVEFAAAQRWRFRHLFVDEFQDVNPLQFRLLETWLGDRRDLCVVGDPNQAIYSWNGADASYLTEFSTRYPGGDVVRLVDNYRSTPQILGAANALLAAGSDRALPLRPHRPDGPQPVVVAFENDRQEARAVARAVRDRHRPGVAWSAQAVLTRTNGQAALIEAALRKVGIPYRMRGGSAFLDAPEVRAALRDLRSSTGPFAVALADLEAALLEEEQPADEAPAGRDTLEALVRMAHEYATLDPSPSVDGLLAWLAATVRAEPPGGQVDAVEIATFHGAKGLEWPVVHVTGLELGLVPIGHARTPEAEAEERRLLYVALTRAVQELRCSWARARTFGTRTANRSPSPYLAPIEAAAGIRPPRAERRPEARRRTGPAARRPSPSPAEDGVLEALRAWRSSAARAAGVPAYVIFHDRTLEAVAAAQPGSRDALLALPGVGPVKAARYGDALLGLVAQHQAS